MIPSSIISDLNELVAAVTAAQPLNTASRLEIAALQTFAINLVADIDSALAAAGGNLDAADPTGFPGDMVGDLIALQQAASDQNTLAAMRGLVGRALFNLTQA